MPLHEFKCTKCEFHQERLIRTGDALDFPCPDCGAPTKKLISSSAVRDSRRSIDSKVGESAERKWENMSNRVNNEIKQQGATPDRLKRKKIADRKGDV
jgi:putative FmdB family regulatory protein